MVTAITTPDRVDGATVRQWLERSDPATVIDVRTPSEFTRARIRGSVNIPLNVVEKHAAQVAERLDREVVLVCQSGARATQAQQRLAGAGVEHLHVLDGGVGEFEAAGGEVVRGRARWGLERQVRFVAGSLVLGGVTASLRAPKASLLAGAVGAGLTLSALTDTCTMGRILLALPYNKGPKDRGPAEVLDQVPVGQQPL